MLFIRGAKENVAINSDGDRKTMLGMISLEKKTGPCPKLCCICKRGYQMQVARFYLYLKYRSERDIRNEEETKRKTRVKC